MEKILIIDDENLTRAGICEVITASGFSPIEASGGKEGIKAFKEGGFSAVVLDMRMPGIDGMEVLAKLKEEDPDVPVIMLTAYGDVPTAVKALKLGAYDFIVKPPNFDNFMETVQRAVEKQALKKEVKRLHGIVGSSLSQLMGRSESIRNIARDLLPVAQSNLSLILEGETGTGKTTLAQEIHNLSKRSDKPFVKVDVNALAESLVESELFGHEKGSFTGADRKRKGFFETANGGTIFIDEIENMSHAVQRKLLQVLEEKEIYLVGSSKPLQVDFRVIAATNAGIEELLRKKNLRHDLFYRLGEHVIKLPPLRERPEDIKFFAENFILDASEEHELRVEGITEGAMSFLMGRPWPGNIRELKSMVRKAVLFTREGLITEKLLEGLMRTQEETGSSSLFPLRQAVRIQEAQSIKEALRLCSGNREKAASLLGISSRSLYSKIKECGITEE
ncbi:MAG: sigma-54-dependent Fis family transcriptional regulator [Nitrospinae bacterium]|nr:sigma-54-dependent Fis family transcriptional regulator [Nitrospinota bacterium]